METKSRSSAAQAARSALLAEARFLSATWLRMRRSATTGSFFGSNLTKKMPQGCFGESGRRRLISWILAAVLGSMPELVGREVVEEIVHVLERVAGDRPAHLVAQVGDELVEALDARELGAVVGRHRLSPR